MHRQRRRPGPRNPVCPRYAPLYTTVDAGVTGHLSDFNRGSAATPWHTTHDGAPRPSRRPPIRRNPAPLTQYPTPPTCRRPPARSPCVPSRQLRTPSPGLGREEKSPLSTPKPAHARNKRLPPRGLAGFAISEICTSTRPRRSSSSASYWSSRAHSCSHSSCTSVS